MRTARRWTRTRRRRVRGTPIASSSSRPLEPTRPFELTRVAEVVADTRLVLATASVSYPTRKFPDHQRAHRLASATVGRWSLVALTASSFRPDACMPAGSRPTLAAQPFRVSARATDRLDV